MSEIVQRMWDNLIGRSFGPMNFRVGMQPAVAIFFAVRSGMQDAREGRPAYFWAVLSNPRYRSELFREGWKDVGKIFIVACVLDAIYQLIIIRGVYIGEMLITATLLAIVPYLLVRGPVNRIARRLWIGKQIVGKAVTGPNNEGSYLRGEE